MVLKSILQKYIKLMDIKNIFYFHKHKLRDEDMLKKIVNKN